MKLVFMRSHRHERLELSAIGYGPWTGVLYPFKQGQQLPGSKGKFDELAYDGEHFYTVEVNSSCYRPPAVKTARSWAARTAIGFELSRPPVIGISGQDVRHGQSGYTRRVPTLDKPPVFVATI